MTLTRTERIVSEYVLPALGAAVIAATAYWPITMTIFLAGSFVVSVAVGKLLARGQPH